ncbi:tetratricopeptide repeat protein [Leptospirillum ferriphilum]|uniref:Uncharacterized protein n=1 Tax=Leptospirillum ferriphilum YSK TaxID=1441628 RepID=A0A059Y2Q6_9BACT|nr:tetratricopeptide repeat protein [Leptospirillum ferriphilum]AIA31846.1 hypothetical protein Y981_08880 [Leptospirillum ferriphilum YSK]OOH77681.1 hypothetical protein BOX30_09565 [Leptospirillum ferriphilum]
MNATRKTLERFLITGIMFMILGSVAVLSGCSTSPSRTESAYLAEREGYRAYREHRWLEAEKHYREALALDPGSLKYRNNLSVILEREGKKEESGKLLDLPGIGESRSGGYILLHQAELLLKSHQYDKARSILERVSLSRNWPPGFQRLMVYADIRTGHFSEASFVLHRLVRERPRDPVVLGYLSIVYRKEGEETLAQKEFIQALDLSRSPGFRKSLAFFFKETPVQ